MMLSVVRPRWAPSRCNRRMNRTSPEPPADEWGSIPGPGRGAPWGPCTRPAHPARLAPVTDGSSTLSERDQAIIQFASSRVTLDEHRYDAIRSRFACSSEEYTLEV